MEAWSGRVLKLVHSGALKSRHDGLLHRLVGKRVWQLTYRRSGWLLEKGVDVESGCDRSSAIEGSMKCLGAKPYRSDGLCAA